MYTVYGHMFENIPAKNAVYTPYMRMHVPYDHIGSYVYREKEKNLRRQWKKHSPHSLRKRSRHFGTRYKVGMHVGLARAV